MLQTNRHNLINELAERLKLLKKGERCHTYVALWLPSIERKGKVSFEKFYLCSHHCNKSTISSIAMHCLYECMYQSLTSTRVISCINRCEMLRWIVCVERLKINRDRRRYIMSDYTYSIEITVSSNLKPPLQRFFWDGIILILKILSFWCVIKKKKLAWQLTI